MTSRKTNVLKKRIATVLNKTVGAPAWAILRKFGKRRSHRWRLNPQVRRNWRQTRLKLK